MLTARKTLLRQKFLSQRQALTKQAWQEQSDLLCLQLEHSPQFREFPTVLGYQSCRQEPDLGYLFTHIDKQWGLPRCVGTGLSWHRWQPLEPLVNGAYGILEPAPELPVLGPGDVDLILVPALAIDRLGYRLGYGGGYYDRLRADPHWAKIPAIGVIFDFAYSSLDLPVDPWDLKLDGVCTESGLSWF